jgi:hypothetical protein
LYKQKHKETRFLAFRLCSQPGVQAFYYRLRHQKYGFINVVDKKAYLTLHNSQVRYLPRTFPGWSGLGALAFRLRLIYHETTFVADNFGVKPWEYQYA